MDKVVSELISPFTRNLTSGSLTAAALFWRTGLWLFHRFHPQALPAWSDCPTGGADLCGLLAKDHGNHQLVVGVLAVVALLITAQTVFARATEVTQFLSGNSWSKRRLFIFFQDRFRERLLLRGYGPRDVPLDSVHDSIHARPLNNRCRRRADHYPHGSPRKPHIDLPRPTDVPLEPTFLGNIFAAMHQQILATHGLRLASCWDLLLIRLSDADKKKFVALSSVMLARAQGVIWAIMTCIWATWFDKWPWRAWWICSCMAAAYMAYRGLRKAACAYCKFLQAIIVVYHFDLYEAAHIAPPKSNLDELLRAGPELSGYLDRDKIPVYIKFLPQANPKDPA